MSFMDLTPQRQIEDLEVDSEKEKKSAKLTQEELDEHVKRFLASGGKVQELEYGVIKDKVGGKQNGVEEMEDGTFRATYNGQLIGEGYYESRLRAVNAVIRHAENGLL